MADTSRKPGSTVMNTLQQFRLRQKKGVQLRNDVADTLHEAGVCNQLAMASSAAHQHTQATAWRISE